MLSNIELSLRRGARKLNDKIKSVLAHAGLAAAAAFEATAQVVDVENEWEAGAWVDLTDELRKREACASCRICS